MYSKKDQEENEKLAKDFLDAVKLTDNTWIVIDSLRPKYGESKVRSMLWQLVDERRVILDSHRRLQLPGYTRPEIISSYIVTGRKYIKAGSREQAEFLAHHDGQPWIIE